MLLHGGVVRVRRHRFEDVSEVLADASKGRGVNDDLATMKHMAQSFNPVLQLPLILPALARQIDLHTALT